jgi:cytochrome c553
MRRIERLLTAGVFVLVILVAIAAQTGLFNPGALGGALFGEVTGIEVPALDNPAMIRRGAAHYDRFCSTCHASPDRPEQSETLEFTPPPPKLHLRAEGWPPEVLLATIKHGIEHTAMPAWPTQNRDDEVWDMVAFLTVLPTLNVPTYRELAGLEIPVEDVPLVAQPCVRCHGPDGRGLPDGAFPRLNIQSDAYLVASLRAFRDGTRASGFMQIVASGLRDDEIAELAAYFAGTAPELSSSPPPQIVAAGIPERKIPACTGCHGQSSPVRPEFPRLAGQHEGYLLSQLRLFVANHRGGGPFGELMRAAASGLTEEDMSAAAVWYSSQAD